MGNKTSLTIPIAPMSSIVGVVSIELALSLLVGFVAGNAILDRITGLISLE